MLAWMQRLFRTVHAAFHRPGTRVFRVVQGLVWILIAFSIALFVVDFFLITSDDPADAIVRRIDRVVLWVFAVELILRVLSFRPRELEVLAPGPSRRLLVQVVGRARYCLRPLLLVDIVTVLALVPALRGLRALRLLRLLRSAPLFRYSNPFLGLLAAFEENRLLFVLGIVMVATATILGGVSLFLIEGLPGESGGNPGVTSVADGVWWALVTLTTVGYGDVVLPAPFGEVARQVKHTHGALVIGVREPDGGEDRINPPEDQEVVAETLLVYLAEAPVLRCVE